MLRIIVMMLSQTLDTRHGCSRLPMTSLSKFHTNPTEISISNFKTISCDDCHFNRIEINYLFRGKLANTIKVIHDLSFTEEGKK